MPANANPKPAAEQAADLEQRLQAANQELLAIFERHYGSTFGTHPGTLLSAAARLAGTCLFCSFGLDAPIPPGTPVLSEQANQQGPLLMDIFQSMFNDLGFPLDPEDLLLSFPEEHKPRLSILEMQQVLLAEVAAILRLYSLDDFQGAQLGAMVCAQLAAQFCAGQGGFSPELAAGIVAMGLVEGSKTMPLPC